MLMKTFIVGSVFKLWCKKQEMFSKDVMSFVDRTSLTQHTTPISLIKQHMLILIMFHCNHCWFILTILPNNYTKNTKITCITLNTFKHLAWLLCVVQN